MIVDINMKHIIAIFITDCTQLCRSYQYPCLVENRNNISNTFYAPVNTKIDCHPHSQSSSFPFI